MPGMVTGAVAVLAAGALAAVPAQEARVARVLVYTESSGFHHAVSERPATGEWSLVEQSLHDWGAEDGRFEAVVSRDVGLFTPQNLLAFDAVFFYTTEEVPIPPAGRDALLEFVRGGGGFIGVHCAADTLYGCPEYGAMLGAYLDAHPWHQEVRVKVEDPSAPMTAHLDDGFRISDEIYQFQAPYARDRLQVLLSLDVDSVDLALPEVRRRDRDFALAWARREGQGRVFYTGLGHREEVWRDERFRGHLVPGILWAAGVAEWKAEPQPRPEPDLVEPPADAPRPACPPGFRVELVAQPPDVFFPSQVLALADGSLLVAEDYMDMPGPAHLPLNRLLRFWWDGQGRCHRSVWARGLNAVFGLAEIDGDVVVMHMPFLSRLADRDGDGVADERADVLTTLGHAAPGWPGGFNDHIVSGIQLGMDGFLYVSVGDKGVPRCRGSDGRELTLRGGGVVRVRPDGSGLEIVARGTRNHLDAALDENDNLFTYDNTDDGLGWWTRLTHVVPTGDYGYPWKYSGPQERFLPPIRDFGGGSPTGAEFARGGGWGEPYDGSLFAAEWAQRVVRRFRFAPQDSTFALAEHEDFLSAGQVPEFRPLDLSFAPLGDALYVADWAYGGWTVKQPRPGRVWRVVREGGPAFGHAPVAAARGLETEDLVLRLASPSQRLRLDAQRELVRREAWEQAQSVVEDAKLATSTRKHALWVLAEGLRTGALAGAPARAAARQLVLAAEQAEEPVAVQAVRALGGLELPEQAAGALESLLQREGALALRREAILALARGGARASSASILPFLRHHDLFLRFTARAALQQLGAEDVARGLADGERAGAQQALLALEGMYSRASVQALRDFAAHGPGDVHDRVAAVEALVALHRLPQPWDGVWWGIQPAQLSPPALEVDWDGTEPALAALRELMQHADPQIQIAALRAQARVRDAEGVAVLRAVLADPATAGHVRGVAVESAVALTARFPELAQALAQAVRDPAAAPEGRAAALRALAVLPGQDWSELFQSCLEDAARELRVAAVEGLAAAQGAAVQPLLERLLEDPDLELQRAALRGLGRVQARATVPRLLELRVQPDLEPDVTLALAAMPDPRAWPAYVDGMAGMNPDVRARCRAALAEVRAACAREVEEWARQPGRPEFVLRELAQLYTDFQPLRRWQLLDGFPREVEHLELRQKDDFRALEKRLARRNFDFDAPLTVTWGEGGERTARWREVAAEDPTGRVNLLPLVQPQEHTVVYASADVLVPAEGLCEFALGSDDSVTVWVDGEEAFRFGGDRAWAARQDRFTLKLSRGEHRVVLRVGQTGGLFDFSLEMKPPPAGVWAAYAPLDPESERAPYREAALRGAGDPGKGQRLFRDPRGVNCAQCHSVSAPAEWKVVGGVVGPDLRGIAARYDRAELIRSVLEPGARVQAAEKSLMPEGVFRPLSLEQFADLVAYLEALR